MFRYGCQMCRVSCTSVTSLIQHVAGKVHRAALLQFSPEEVEQLGRLQYFLNTFVKEPPVLGLEYVQEKQVDDSYVYTCQLCNEGFEWRHMAIHVMDLKHTERYLNKHHSDYLSVFPDCADDNQHRMVLGNLAAKIYSKYGRKEIRSVQSGVASLSLPEVACPPPAGDILCFTEDDVDLAAPPPQGEPPEILQMPPEFNKFFKKQDRTVFHCAMCGVTCSSAVAFCEHVQGKVHKNNMEIALPNEVKELGRLGYFFNNHMKDSVFLGLEYLVEVNLGTTYKFTCQLCKVDANLLKIIGHITDVEHVESYITKHHAHLLPNVPKFHWKKYCIALRGAAVTVYEKHGRQEIQVKKISVKDLPEEGKGLEDKASCLPPSTHSSEDTSHSKPPLDQQSHNGPSNKNKFKQSTVDGPPFTKRGVFRDYKDASSSKQPFLNYRTSRFDERQPQNTQRHVIHLKYLTPMKEFEFNTNNDFLEYLANFEIDDNKDVVFIRKVTQNCIRALMSFQEEEAAEQKSSYVSESAFLYRRTDRENIDVCNREEADGKKSIYRSHTSRTRKESPDIYLREREPERHKSSHQPNAPLSRKHETYKQTPDISYSEREIERQRSRHRPDSPLASKGKAYKESSDARFHEPKAKRQKSSHWPETSSRADKETLDLSIPKQQMESQRSNQPEASRTDKDAPGINVGEQEAKLQRISPQPEPPLACISKSDGEPPNIPVKTDLHSSVSVSNVPSSLLPANDLTDFLFNSIKEMNESEVVGIFQKIATTNPEFQGMDISAVIKFLKDCGR